MARSVKEKEYTVKRNEILDAAQHLIYSKGYEQMTIQDILDLLQISKGAFYHYFDSKQALLEALIERMQGEAEQLLLPLAQDPTLSALDKLQRFFPTISRWKTARKDFFLSLLRVWYSDDNAIFRQKLRTTGLTRIIPLLTEIIRQGVQEGSLTTSYPEQVGEVILSLLIESGDTLARLLLIDESKPDNFQHAKRLIAAYADVLERALGAPPGSLPIIDTDTLKEWFVSPEDNESKRDNM